MFGSDERRRDLDALSLDALNLNSISVNAEHQYA
jgi:hypothetical protein